MRAILEHHLPPVQGREAGKQQKNKELASHSHGRRPGWEGRDGFGLKTAEYNDSDKPARTGQHNKRTNITTNINRQHQKKP